jgi:hypothetical protein
MTATSLRSVPLTSAFAVPEPGGPPVTAVLERRYSNAIQQEILLATSARTPGQNMLRVQLFGPAGPEAGQTSLRQGYLPPTGTSSEMRELLPGVAMKRSQYYVQNKYGPFGYAVGRAPSGDTCFYGWQRITSTGNAQTWVGNKGSIQVRLRLCDQTASEEQLLQAMYGFTINVFYKDGNWNPFGEPLPPDETLGRAGAPIYPVGVERFQTVVTPRAPEPARAQAPRRRAAAPSRVPAEAIPQPPARPTPVGPLVPPPPGTTAYPPAAPQPAAAVPAPPCIAEAGQPCR